MRDRCSSLLGLVLSAVLCRRTRSFVVTTTTPAHPSCATAAVFPRRPRRRRVSLFGQTPDVLPDDDDGDSLEAVDVQVLADNLESDDDDSADDWLPDAVKAKARQEEARIYAEKVVEESKAAKESKDGIKDPANRPSPYTDEEEDVIAAMGGKTWHPARRREIGFLGDSTLQEIAMDYSVPVCYLADVLCVWGTPVPISIRDRLGDLCTGEQAFSLLEAVNSLDVAALHDRYSNSNVLQFCNAWEIPLQEAFEMAVKEGWSLPFGVQTCLRVEQEDEVLRVLGQGRVERDYDAEAEVVDYE
jgi:hypothetical protein